MRVFGVIALLFVLAAFGACSRTPDEPTFDNPFDPNGTAPGTGYDLRVEASGLNIIMTWKNIPGVQTYNVYWSDTNPVPADSDSIRTELAPPASVTPNVQYIHKEFTAEKTNWYRVRGFAIESGAGGANAMESSVSVAVDITVQVAPSGGITSTPTKSIQLDLLTGVAPGIELSNQASFAISDTVYVMPAKLETVEWELATTVWESGMVRNVEQNDELWVHFRTLSANSVGPADSTVVQVVYQPSLSIERGVRATPGILTMVDVAQVFRIDPIPEQSPVSVVRNIWLPDSVATEGEWVKEEDIPLATVDDPIIVNLDVENERAEANQIVATLRSDFGFEEEAVLELEYPTELGEPSIVLVGGNVVTTETNSLEIQAAGENAGKVFLSEDPAFPNPVEYVWDVQAETFVVEYDLVDKTLGERYLYAAFSNPILGEAKVAQLTFFVVEPPARGRR
jgi:hypothetical protein